MSPNLANISFVGAESDPAARASVAAPRARRTVRGQLPPWARLLGDGAPGESAGATGLDPLIHWVLRRAGLNPHVYRVRTLERRLASCRRQLGTGHLAVAQTLVEHEPQLLAAALNSLLIGVTEFFRDPQVFEELRHAVLPELLRTRLGVRVFAPGVSAGQELYSVAMLLAECQALARSELTGLDCRPDAIAWARAGIFPDEAMAGVPPAWRMRYFLPQGGGWQVRPELRDATRFEVGDLFRHTSVALWDIILFRNVAIYFDPAHAVRAWELLCGQLAPGGYFVAGKAEKPPAHLPLERVAPSIYRKQFA